MGKDASRKLAVILHADVVGSTALVQQNETLAHTRMQNAFRELTKTIHSCHGITHELRGDALVAEFNRASDAVAAALAYQASNREINRTITDEIRPELRIGISLGEVVIADSTVTGAGVVLAQRLEQLADPNGVCIQGAAQETVPQRLPFNFNALGEKEVKGFGEPVRVYSVSQRDGASTYLPESAPDMSSNKRSNTRFPIFALTSAGIAIVALLFYLGWIPGQQDVTLVESTTSTVPQDKRSIAVLPFKTLSEETNQIYFSEGLTNDIITDLSKFSNLRVIAEYSVRGLQAENIKQVGTQLDVAYVLAGKVQRAGGKVRINVQLIDVNSEHSLWAERHEFELDDVFRVQDEITSNVVTSLQVILTEEEKGRGSIRHTSNIKAYDLYLRGRTYLKGTRRGHKKARELFDRAIKLDPEFAAAYAEKSFTYFSSFIMPMSRDPKVIQAAYDAAQKAVKLDDNLPLAHARLAWAYFATHQHTEAIASARRAVALGPNDAEANVQLGNILNWSGKPEEGQLHVEKAIRLNPNHPYYYLFYLGQSYYLQNKNDEAIEMMQRVVTRAPYFLPVRRHLAVLYSEKGMLEEAKAETREVLRIFPAASIEDERARCFYRWTPEIMNRFFTGLRKSGMPEGTPGLVPVPM